jgi:hypothetical protein
MHVQAIVSNSDTPAPRHGSAQGNNRSVQGRRREADEHVRAVARPVGQRRNDRRGDDAQEHRRRQDYRDLLGTEAARFQPQGKIGQMNAHRHENRCENHAEAQFEVARLDELCRRKRRKRHRVGREKADRSRR